MGTSCIAVGRTKTKQFLRQLFSLTSSWSAIKHHEPLFERLPEDIVNHIHSFLPVIDAARAACVSREFLRSWRCYPNLTIGRETYKKSRDKNAFVVDFVDHFLENHSSIGLEIFRLDLRTIDISYLDRWIQIAVRLGVKELGLVMSLCAKEDYSVPCSFFSDEAATSSIQFLDLQGCAFRPTAALGCLRGLRKLRLCFVNITDEGLGHLISKASALEQMDIFHCSKIICLRIPCTLQKLTRLRVGQCLRLQSVDIDAPKLSTFHCLGPLVKDISVADPCQLKDVYLSSGSPGHTFSFACARLPAIAPNVESLTLFSLDEIFNTPTLISKFTCLSKLEINIEKPQPAFNFDVLSLVSFLGASPTLNSFILHVGKDVLRHDNSIARGDNASYLRWKPQCRDDRLREVVITGFCSDKNLVQFVIHILESIPSVKCVTLDTTSGYYRNCGIDGKEEVCTWMSDSIIAEAHKSVKAVNRYIRGRVPSGVRLQVVEPCSRCHTDRRW